MNRYSYDFSTLDYCSQISKSLYLLDFLHTHFSLLVINTTVSTWIF